MKKLGLGILSIAAIFSVLTLTTSCSSGVENAGEEFKVITMDELKAKSQESPIVVEFWHSFGHSISSELDPLIENFEKEMEEQGIYIDVKAESTGGGYDGLRSRVNMGTKSNSIPTMVLGYPDHFADYISSGILLPLDDYVNSTDSDIGIADTSDFVDSYWAECQMTFKADGDSSSSSHIVSIPFNKSTEIMYYNANVVDPILEANGWLSDDGKWENPTWEQLFTVSQTIKDTFDTSGKITWTYDNTPYETEKLDYPIFIDSEANFFITTAKQWGAKGQDVYTKVNDDGSGTVVFDNSVTREAQNYFIEKANAGLWNIPKKVNQSYGSSLMINGTAFISIGSTAGVNNNDSSKYQLKCAAIPQRSYDENDVQAVIQQGTNAAILSKNSNNYTRLAAWLLIKYLTNTENTITFSENTGYLPVRKSARDSEEFTSFLSNENDLFVGNAAKAINSAYDQLDYLYTDPAFKGSSIVRDRLDTMIQAVYCNGKSIDDAIASAYKDLKDKEIDCESQQA